MIPRIQLNKGKLLDMMSRSERQLNMELQTNAGLSDISPEVRKRSFECTWERTKTKQPAQPIAKQNVPDARRFSQRIPCPYFTTEGRGFTAQSSFFIKKSNFRKERGKLKWHFLQRQ